MRRQSMCWWIGKLRQALESSTPDDWAAALSNY